MIITGILSVLTPTTNEAIMMIVVPKILRSEIVQKDMPELYNLAYKIMTDKLLDTAKKNQ